MKCPNCGHVNEGGKFCENCGTQLIETTENTVQQPNPPVNNGGTGTVQSEDYLKKTKDQSKQYITYFIDVLKKPYASLHAPLENQHFIHAIITFILYSLFIPLMFYFGLKGLMNTFSEFGAEFNEFVVSNNLSISFMDAVVIPTIAFIVFMLLVVGFTVISIKLGRVNITFKEVFTRFGILLIPFVFILSIGVVLSILKVSLFILFMVIGLVGSIYIVVPVLIAFYKKGSTGEGMDVVYGTLLAYILTFIVILIMGEMLIDSLVSYVQNTLLNQFGGY